MKAYEFLWKSMVGLAISGLSGAAQAQYIVHTVGGPGKPLATVACMSNNGWVAGTFTPKQLLFPRLANRAQRQAETLLRCSTTLPDTSGAAHWLSNGSSPG